MENPSIISHVSVGTNNYEAAKQFYTELFATVGIQVMMDVSEHKAICFGKQFPEFWVQQPHNGQPASVGNGVHVSFMLNSPAEVDAFYAKALELGATDNGPAGPREEYSAQYYGAFVIDLDGNRIEAMHWNEPAN